MAGLEFASGGEAEQHEQHGSHDVADWGARDLALEVAACVSELVGRGEGGITFLGEEGVLLGVELDLGGSAEHL